MGSNCKASRRNLTAQCSRPPFARRSHWRVGQRPIAPTSRIHRAADHDLLWLAARRHPKHLDCYAGCNSSGISSGSGSARRAAEKKGEPPHSPARKQRQFRRSVRSGPPSNEL
mmetsp:Transcript_24433/g.81206  ORF Transcript_24433/g.81206 Transcript_24433/m.81206 type:complete len:113 (+) Transcript_24433:396-734(+)